MYWKFESLNFFSIPDILHMVWKSTRPSQYVEYLKPSKLQCLLSNPFKKNMRHSLKWEIVLTNFDYYIFFRLPHQKKLLRTNQFQRTTLTKMMLNVHGSADRQRWPYFENLFFVRVHLLCFCVKIPWKLKIKKNGY